MNIFKKLGQQVYHYESCLEVYALKLQMRQKLAATSIVDEDFPLLKGKFTKAYEFEIGPVGEIAYIRRPFGPLPLTYIKGELLPNGSKTAVLIQIVPYTAWVPLFCSMVVGLVGISQFAENKNATVLIVSLVLLLGVPVFFIRLILKQKERLRANFTCLFGFTLVKACGDEPLA